MTNNFFKKHKKSMQNTQKYGIIITLVNEASLLFDVIIEPYEVEMRIAHFIMV